MHKVIVCFKHVLGVVMREDTKQLLVIQERRSQVTSFAALLVISIRVSVVSSPSQALDRSSYRLIHLSVERQRLKLTNLLKLTLLNCNTVGSEHVWAF